MTDTAFLAPERLLRGGPRRFNIAIERLLWHVGFRDVRIIDGAGDAGGDILAVRGRELFVIQNKWSTQEWIGRDGVDEVERAKAKYSADRAVLITNTRPGRAALERQRALAQVGVGVAIWSGHDLAALFSEIPDRIPEHFALRPYQEEAVARTRSDLRANGRALLILATGLGKTVVAGEVARHHLEEYGDPDVLVVAHLAELVQQLEKSLWRHLPKRIPTQVLTGDYKPPSLSGVTCATIESGLKAVYDGYRPSLIIVDETHHVNASGHYQRLLDLLEESHQLGVTATPWRGDRYDITERFGPASFKMGIAEGMSRGYLAQVDYRIFTDNIDWDFVRQQSEFGYTLKDLNRHLFLPQRDEQMLDHLSHAWRETPDPRAVVFCQSIEHGERVAELLAKRSPNWARARCVHSGQSRRDRDVLMSQFRLGRIPIVTTIDIFNEGVDIPDVNIIAFLRVTHSRRIFVQQLGRGLRIRAGKDRVRVLDFVTDIRRVAAVLDLRRSLDRYRGVEETLTLSESKIEFENQDVGTLLDAWIEDAANVETAADEVRLQFPEVPGGIA